MTDILKKAEKVWENSGLCNVLHYGLKDIIATEFRRAWNGCEYELSLLCDDDLAKLYALNASITIRVETESGELSTLTNSIKAIVDGLSYDEVSKQYKTIEDVPSKVLLFHMMRDVVQVNLIRVNLYVDDGALEVKEVIDTCFDKHLNKLTEAKQVADNS